jgi:hypothetical protein
MNSEFRYSRIHILISLRGNIMSQNTAINVYNINKDSSIKKLARPTNSVKPAMMK